MKYGIYNFRRLEKVEPIEFKRITILVGRNSSGKSSYLRSLLLLKQSITTKTNSPILWYGHIVDFGSFKDTVINHNSRKTISFKFEVDSFKFNELLMRFRSRKTINPDLVKKLTYEVTIKSSSSKTIVSQISLSAESPGIEYLLFFKENGHLSKATLNNEKVDDDIVESLIINTDTIFPHLIPKEGKENQFFPNWVNINPYNNIPKIIIDRIKNLINGFDGYESKFSDDKLNDIIFDFAFNGLEFLKDDLKLSEQPEYMREYLQVIFNDKESRTRLLKLLSLLILPHISRVLNIYFSEYLGNTVYLGPARARSERYYRYQELAVAEIDPDGKNLPMFLKSLTSDQINKLSQWIEAKFDYGIKLSDSEGHISINQTKDNIETNIVDTGYGLSQILPVLAQVWWAQYKPRNKRITEPNLIIIEQPELHLHPAHQSMLADAFVHEAKNTQLHFLIETHSESLINRIGALVANGDINSDDVNIVIFSDDDEKQNVSTTQIATYDKDGCLINWPYGFFQL